MFSTDVPPPPDVEPRASDSDRDRAVDALSAACSDGRLGLEAFSRRVDSALVATTVPELALLTSDLQETAPPVVGSAGLRGSSWLVAVMASTVRRGRWHLSPTSRAVAVMGDCLLDLRNVEVEATHTHILAVALMGSITVIVPEGIDCDISGVAVMGSKTMRGGAVRPLLGSPTIRVTCLALMGQVDVRVLSLGSDSQGADRSAYWPELPGRNRVGLPSPRKEP